MSALSIGEMRKDFCANVLQYALENFDRRGCNGGGREPLRNVDTFLWRGSYLGIPREKQVCIHIQKTRECLKCGYHVSPKSSPLQGMKAQPLQSLFVPLLPILVVVLSCTCLFGFPKTIMSFSQSSLAFLFSKSGYWH